MSTTNRDDAANALWMSGITNARARVDELRDVLLSGVPVERRGTAPRALEELSLSFEELQVAEEELRTQHEALELAQLTAAAEQTRYRELFEQAPVPYFVTDAHGVVRHANAAAGVLLNRPVDRLRGKPIAVFVHGASRRRLRRLINHLAMTNTVVGAPLIMLTHEDNVARCRVTATPARNARGGVDELRWLVVDDTRQRRRERRTRRELREMERVVAIRTAELEEVNRLNGTLISTVGHELRTALAAIGGYAELLERGLRGTLTPQQAGDVRRIIQAHLHLSTIVDDLLSYNAVTGGRLSLDMRCVTIAAVLRDIGVFVAPQVAARPITFQNDGGDATLNALCDADRLRQIVLNLLSNAIKFTPPGGVVSLGWSATDDGSPQGGVAISVRDNGPGIPPDKLAAIFEPFVRLSRNDVPGTGLGLAISRDLAKSMSGRLEATSELGVGSVFTLYLPRSTALATEGSGE